MKGGAMVDNKPEGCVSPAAGPLVAGAGRESGSPPSNAQGKEERRMNVSVGKEAPDFEAAAFHAGGFKNVRLSSFRGKWVLLCFYPGDFTFV
jgi:peroxiredoxin (alkyl hydroperoxide reductase subunit C)